ncbi:anti-sigma factor family protein [Subtercola sp. YIM 133946]|uniref:anti-sigma factor family protein n=1 Tax=Subtercola sp. YIM 133946 TaxID=3118909 RepID=UPI002F933941
MTPDDLRLPPDDRYREWDAAYVLGALALAERLEYEQHLARCPECTAALAELAGMPGLLAAVTPDEAFALDAVPARPWPAVLDAPPTILPTLLARARAARRRSRLTVLAIGVGSVAAAVAVTLVVALAITPAASTSVPDAAPTSSAATAPPSDPANAGLASQVQFVPQVPGPLSAVASLRDEPWGTRIEWKCTYAEATEGAGTGAGVSGGEPLYGDPGAPPATSGSAGGSAAGATGSASVGYGMNVTDRSGNTVQVATWTSGPGTVAEPTATTSIRLADIAEVAIVALGSGQVLLASTL